MAEIARKRDATEVSEVSAPSSPRDENPRGMAPLPDAAGDWELLKKIRTQMRIPPDASARENNQRRR